GVRQDGAAAWCGGRSTVRSAVRPARDLVDVPVGGAEVLPLPSALRPDVAEELDVGRLELFPRGTDVVDEEPGDRAGREEGVFFVLAREHLDRVAVLGPES